MAVLTDGREWHFFLPDERGDYDERGVYKFDILERQIDESLKRLDRYLSYKGVCTGEAIEYARSDYRDVTKTRIIEKTVPEAWMRLIREKDELLIDLIIDKVESLCGYSPDSGSVSSFLKSIEEVNPGTYGMEITTQSPKLISSRRNDITRSRTEYRRNEGSQSFTLHGKLYRFRYMNEVLINVFLELQKQDPGFFEKFAGLEKHGHSRRYLGNSPEELFPERPDFAESESHWRQISPGWYLEIHEGKDNMVNIIKMACNVAGVEFGKDLVINLG